MSALVKNCLSDNYLTIWRNLDAICECLDTLYDINDGGCCYIAYCIAELLEKDNIPFEVILFDVFNGGLTKACDHVGIKLEIEGDTYIINQADYASSEISSIQKLTSKQLLEYYKSVSWNKMYDIVRNKFIKYVITLLYANFTRPLRKRRSSGSSK